MILKGKVKKGLGNASFWVEKIEKVFYEKTGMRLFYGTLNIELEQPYEFENYWIIKQEEYGGTQNVFVQKCKIYDIESYIVRAEKTAHKSNVIEIVSNIKFREKLSLKDNDTINVVI